MGGWNPSSVLTAFSGCGSFSSQFPDESDEEMTDRVHDDVTETKREANVGDAWASLEHNVLTNELTESE